jgi:hypothetical protein
MLAVQEKKGRGRALICSRDIAAGEVVLSEDPTLLVVANDQHEYVCCWCMRLLSGRANRVLRRMLCGLILIPYRTLQLQRLPASQLLFPELPAGCGSHIVGALSCGVRVR